MNTNRDMINRMHDDINAYVIDAVDKININLDGERKYVGRLRACNAVVWETEHWYLLQSYATFVAAIDKETGIMYDFLRYVYGYTATSAQHIAKFAADYHATQRYTYRP